MYPSEMNRLKEILQGLRRQLELAWIVYFPHDPYAGLSNIEMWEQLWRKSNEVESRLPSVTNILFKWDEKDNVYKANGLRMTREFVEQYPEFK